MAQRQGENYQASDADNYLHDCYDIQTSGGKKEERNARIRAIQAELFQEPSTQAKSGQDGNDKSASDRLILLEEVINVRVWLVVFDMFTFISGYRTILYMI